MTAAMAACLAVSAGAGAAWAQALPPADAKAAAARLDALSEAAQAAMDRDDDKALAAVLADLEAFIAAPGFSGLPEDERRIAYVEAGRTAYLVDRAKLALDYFKKATAFDGAPVEDWALRFYAAHGADDVDDALVSLRTIMRRAPDQLEKMPSGAILDVAKAVGARPQGAEAEFSLLMELFDAGWDPDPEDWSEVEGHWRDLTQTLIYLDQVDKAGRIARRILGPYVLAQMHADKRFDPVIQADLAGFDIAKAAEADLARARKRVKAHPLSLDARTELAMRLQALNRLDEALAVVDEAISLARPSGAKNTVLEDMEKLNWAYDVRSRILRAAGREGAALEALEEGAKASEQGATNVSQTLNLGYDLMRLGRPREAMATVAKAGRASVYGQSVAAQVRVCAHHQLGDPSAAAPDLAFLRQHRKDASGTLSFALLCANDLDAVAAIYVEDLADPKRRREVLTDIQDYAYAASQAAFSRAIAERRRKVVARPEVKAAIDKVGRVIRVPLMDE